MNARVEVRGRLDEEQVSAVLSVVEVATERDGLRPLSEHVMLHLRYGGDPGAKSVLIYDGDDLAGFAHIDPTDPVEGPSGEMVIHPDFRRRGLGRELLAAVLTETDGRLRLWAHGDHEGASRLAAATGFTRSRSLWQMRRSLFAPLPSPAIPEGVRLRHFEPGRDENAWIKLNARAFARHPEQGAWTIEDLKRREQEPWFDPKGFFLAERGDTLAGFHWTKVHGRVEHAHGPQGEHAHDPIGEVYVVGVDPSEQGSGLGRALTLSGLCHLRSRGLAQVMLYVDEDNTSAIRLYESLGFARWDTDVMYRH